jgi:CRISPR system Cascade subunit CasC
MLIEIHMVQNHSPANLNRDDLGAPKTCYFGGVLRSRISSQCIKRSIRTSDEFRTLLAGRRTRDLAKRILDEFEGGQAERRRVEKILDLCGFKPKKSKKSTDDEVEDDEEKSQRSKAPLFVTQEAIRAMARLLQEGKSKSEENLAKEFANSIARFTAAPDMALSGRMLEPDKSAKKIWGKQEKNVEAALQVAHAISTHEARPEVDYFVAMGDGKREEREEAGADLIGEQLYASACFYKYFSIRWETLVENLKGNEDLAAHTVGAFIRGAALTVPSGKKNSHAHNNRPDGILIEIRNGSPISYANAFAKPAAQGERDIISQSIAQLGQYVHDLDTGYGKPEKRFWFSPNLRYPLNYVRKEKVKEGEKEREKKEEVEIETQKLGSLNDLIPSVIRAIGYDWAKVQEVVINSEVRS